MRRILINISPKKKDYNEWRNYLYTYLPVIKKIAIGLFFVCVLLSIVLFFEKRKIQKYQLSLKDLGRRYSQIVRLKRRINAREKEIGVLKGAIRTRQQLIPLLKEIILSVPKNVGFTSLSFDHSTLEINGYIVEWKEDFMESLDKFIKALKSQEKFPDYFKKINLEDSFKDIIHGVTVLKFKLRCQR